MHASYFKPQRAFQLVKDAKYFFSCQKNFFLLQLKREEVANSRIKLPFLLLLLFSLEKRAILYSAVIVQIQWLPTAITCLQT